MIYFPDFSQIIALAAVIALGYLAYQMVKAARQLNKYRKAMHAVVISRETSSTLAFLTRMWPTAIDKRSLRTLAC